MGQSVSQVKADAAKQNAEDEKQANDALNSLMTIAKSNLEIFKQDITNTKDKSMIPINKILRSKKIIKCGVTKDANKLKEAITGMISDIASGDFVGAITGGVSVGLDALFGNSSGNISEYQSMTVSCGKLGGFFRIDYYLYMYEFTSTSLISITKNVMCCSVVISSVNTDTLNENDVKVILQLSFPDEPKDKLQALLKEVLSTTGIKNKRETEWQERDADDTTDLEWRQKYLQNMMGLMDAPMDKRKKLHGNNNALRAPDDQKDEK